MSRMFCTVQQAAATLQASEEQINALLERGILPEFRQGPHRLLRTADVGALDLLRVRGPQARHRRSHRSPPRRPRAAAAGRPRTRALREDRRGAAAVARPPRPPRTKKAGRRTASPNPGTEPGQRAGPDGEKARGPAGRQALSPSNSLPVFPSYAVAVPRPPAVVRPPSGPPPAQTLRQWFWMGLVQDRPSAIALLSGLALLALSALAAGICLAAEGF